MNKRESQCVLEEDHSYFLVSEICNNNTGSITQWVEEKLINENSDISQVSKNAFFEAEKSLLSEYIERNRSDKLYTLLNAIDNERFKDKPNYKKLKLNQCKVLAGAIKIAERFLKEDDVMHKDLHNLLETKYNKELIDISLEEREKKFKDEISTTINEALEIVSYEKQGIISKL